MDAIPITEKLLSGAGGWQAMKAGRELFKAGRVSEANYEPPLLVGEVREAQKTYRSGLRIRSAIEIENICTCRESRQWGKVCAHSLGVGLAWLAPAPATPKVVPNESRRDEGESREFFPLGEPGTQAVALRFILPPNFGAAWAKQRIMVCVEAEWDGRQIMLDALPANERIGCDENDRGALQSLAESLGTKAAGLNTLAPAAFLRWLPALRGHPRVSFGKNAPVEVAAEMARPVIRVRRSELDLELLTQLGHDEVFLVAGAEAWILRRNAFLQVGSHLPLRLTNVLQERLRLKGERADEFLALELPLWREVVELQLPDGLDLPSIEPARPQFELKIEGSLQRVRAKLRCRYAERPAFAPMTEPENRFVVRDLAHPQQLFVRNFKAEKEAVARLARAWFWRGERRLRNAGSTSGSTLLCLRVSGLGQRVAGLAQFQPGKGAARAGASRAYDRDHSLGGGLV